MHGLDERVRLDRLGDAEMMEETAEDAVKPETNETELATVTRAAAAAAVLNLIVLFFVDDDVVVVVPPACSLLDGSEERRTALKRRHESIEESIDDFNTCQMFLLSILPAAGRPADTKKCFFPLCASLHQSSRSRHRSS